MEKTNPFENIEKYDPEFAARLKERLVASNSVKLKKDKIAEEKKPERDPWGAGAGLPKGDL